MKRKGITIVPLVIALLFGLFQYFSADKVTNPETGKSMRVALSSDQEEALGLQSYKEILSQSDTVQSGPEVDLVVRVAEKLAAATGEAADDFKWEVSVIRSEQANAFCLPGGKIAIYTGILPYTKTEAGLAAVMGHEMAHAVARHGSQRILRSSLTQTVMMGAALSTGNMDPRDRQMLMGLLGAGAQFGVILPFSRDHETEADQMGLMYMARAGYDPREAIRFWQRMSEAGGQKQPEFASTHPAHGTRVSNLEAFMPKAMEAYEQSERGIARAGR